MLRERINTITNKNGYGQFAENPPKKWRICSTLPFFHMFFEISFHVRFNTYSKVTILYPKGNSMLLNTFLTLFWCENYFYVLSATKYQNCSLKNRQKTPQIWGVFGDFLVNNFGILSLRARKNNFFTRIMLETCSVTSNYP